MKRILLFLTGVIGLYLIAVIAINLIPQKTEQPPAEAPQIQIEQPDETASPSAEEELVLPDL